jgi:hypothetical protein
MIEILTPQEQAKQLVDKFINIDCLKDFEGMDIGLAKQCALVSVNQILDKVMIYWELAIKDPYFITQKTHYLQVRKEIEKL